MPPIPILDLVSQQLLEHALRLTAPTASNLAVIVVDSTTTVVTLGVPWLLYRMYRWQAENETSAGRMYAAMIKALGTQWDIYYYLSISVLPVPFPMVAASGIPLCSKATFVAVMTFTVGVVSMATSAIYKFKFKPLHNDRIIGEWKMASERPWRKVPNKSFWVLMALPTLSFFLSVGLLITTAVLTIWERPLVGMSPGEEVHACPAKQLQAFKYILLVTLAAAGTHFGFIMTKVYSMTALQSTGIAEAA